MKRYLSALLALLVCFVTITPTITYAEAVPKYVPNPQLQNKPVLKVVEKTPIPTVQPAGQNYVEAVTATSILVASVATSILRTQEGINAYGNSLTDFNNTVKSVAQTIETRYGATITSAYQQAQQTGQTYVRTSQDIYDFVKQQFNESFKASPIPASNYPMTFTDNGHTFKVDFFGRTPLHVAGTFNYYQQHSGEQISQTIFVAKDGNTHTVYASAQGVNVSGIGYFEAAAYGYIELKDAVKRADELFTFRSNAYQTSAYFGNQAKPIESPKWTYQPNVPDFSFKPFTQATYSQNLKPLDNPNVDPASPPEPVPAIEPIHLPNPSEIVEVPPIVLIDEIPYHEIPRPNPEYNPALPIDPIINPERIIVYVPVNPPYQNGQPVYEPIPVRIPNPDVYGPPPPPIPPEPPVEPPNLPRPDLKWNPFVLVLPFIDLLRAIIEYLLRFFEFIIKLPVIPEKPLPYYSESFNWFKEMEFGGFKIYNTIVSVAIFFLSLVVYKVIRRTFGGS